MTLALMTFLDEPAHRRAYDSSCTTLAPRPGTASHTASLSTAFRVLQAKRRRAYYLPRVPSMFYLAAVEPGCKGYASTLFPG